MRKLFILVFLLLIPTVSGATIASFPWSTTFNYGPCTQRGQGGQADCDSVRTDGLYWDWYGAALNGKYTQATSAANNASGGGGNGARIWIGDGFTVMSGSIRAEFAAKKELWVRWYERYQSGFRWSGGLPSFSKELYFGTATGGTSVIPEMYFDQFSLTAQGGSTYADAYQVVSTYGWPSIMGGANSDGQFHCYEIHLKMDTNGSDGIGQLWIDGILRVSNTGVNWSFGSSAARAGWINFDFKSNANQPTNGQDMYVDVDDMAIYTTTPPGRDAQGNPFIGPLGSSGTLPTISGTPGTTATVGTLYSFIPTSSGATSFSYSGTLPPGISFNTSTGSLIGTPTTSGTYSNIVITANNGFGSASLPAFSIAVAAGQPPTIGGTPVTSATVGTAYSFTPTSARATSFTSTGTLPPGLSLNTSTGVLSGTPTTSGTYGNLVITAVNGYGTASLPAFTITVSTSTAGQLIFQESFENNSYASRGWYDNTNQGTIVSGGQSGNCLQWAWASGQTNPTNGGSSRYKFTNATDTIYMTYYIKFMSGWRGSQQTFHPHLIYLLSDLDLANLGDYPPLANNYLNTYIEFLSDVGGSYGIHPQIALQDERRVNTSNGTPPNDLRAVTENRSVNRCNTPLYAGVTSGDCYADNPYYSSNTWRSSATVSTNVWHKVETYLKMNTVSAGKGQNDGIMQVWVDGALVLDQSNVLYRTAQDSTKKWKGLILAPYIGSGAPIAETMWLDELKIYDGLGQTSQPGACGSANNSLFSAPPSTNLCSLGTASSVSTSGSVYTWTCTAQSATSCQAFNSLGTFSMWPGSAVPGTPDAGADPSVELGLKFTSDISGYVTGVKFYKSSANTGVHTGSLWNASGTQLATGTFSNETASGWQTLTFSSPVAITSGQTYVVSYHCSTGHYSDDLNYFATARDQAPLHAPTSAGVFTYGSGSVFPTSVFSDSNYYVDVVFTPTVDLVPPVTTAAPAAGTYTGTQTVGLTCNDNVACSATYYCLGATCTPTTPYTAPVTLSSSNTLKYYSVDTSGNIENIKSGVYTINQVIIPPGSPNGLSYTKLSTSSVRLDWVASTPGSNVIAGYMVYRDGTYVGSSVTNSYTDTGLSGGISYSYTVVAYDGASPPNYSGFSTALVVFLDNTAPTITAFTLPATASSLTVVISAFTATDNVAVSQYCVQTTNSSSGCSWSSTPQTSVTFPSEGAKTAYAFAKDSSGNVSNSASANVTITLPDVTKPVITSFSIQHTGTTLTLGVTSFTATDNRAVTGYCISGVNSSANCQWGGSVPTSITFGSAGSVTAYAFVRDAAGNVSNSASDSAVITLGAPSGGRYNVPCKVIRMQ